MGLPRPAWVRLNRLRTSVGRFQSPMHKWGLAPISICKCGALDQIAANVILECPLHRASEDAMECWSWMTRLDAGSIKSSPTSEDDLVKKKVEKKAVNCYYLQNGRISKYEIWNVGRDH